MPVIYRQKRFSELTPAQQALKLEADAKYEADVLEISDPFYKKKHTAGVTPAEEQVYTEAKTKLWDDYYEWAIDNDLYDIITPQQQLTESEQGLYDQLQRVNELRAGAGRRELE
ncbi:unnamed protein product, partial [marine sediment metagenome]